VPDGLLLWRGDHLDGSDVDMLALPRAEEPLRVGLRAAGLRPGPGDPGHTVWSDGGRPLDVLHASAWPRHYPSLDGLVARATREGDLPRVASPEDRLLIYAADALTGRAIDKLVMRARPLVARPGAAQALREVAGEEGLELLASLIEDPEEMARRARRGRLPYTATVRLALRSDAGRSALRTRLQARVRRLAPSRSSPSRAPLVALSGMDGAGKSTAAAVITECLEQQGWTVTTQWARVGHGMGWIEPVAKAVKRLLGRRGYTGDPVAARGPTAAGQQHEADDGPITRAWVAIVAGSNARNLWRASAPRRSGTAVVSDRWVADALVDLRLRYGSQPLAEAITRLASPRPDLAILLEVDAATAARRKPEDQAPEVLAGMERHYADVATRLELVIIDATAPPAAVAQHLREAIDQAITGPGGP